MERKHVLITGSSRGIGRACALAFAKNGWHVFINCRNSLDQLKETETHDPCIRRQLHHAPRRCREP